MCGSGSRKGRQAAAGDIPVYTREAELAVALETEDGLVLGDFMGDSRDEIVVADASEDRITIYGYAGAGVELEELARFRYDYHADDELAAGYFNARDREQLLVIRGHELYGRSAGTIEIISHFRGENPGDRWAMKKAGGRTARFIRRERRLGSICGCGRAILSQPI
ncbi:MAG: hypothetical protein KJ072_03865 [Verrucomicrobia bacterium]|nr:hypothetical protein [Verrucomicrobiota bacterium]